MYTTRSASRARCVHTRPQALPRSSDTGTQGTAASPSLTASRQVVRAAHLSCRGWRQQTTLARVPASTTLRLRLHQQQGISAPLLVQSMPPLRWPSPIPCCPAKTLWCLLCPPHSRAPRMTGRQRQDGAPRSQGNWLLRALRLASATSLPRDGVHHCLAAWWCQGLPTVSSRQS